MVGFDKCVNATWLLINNSLKNMAKKVKGKVKKGNKKCKK